MKNYPGGIKNIGREQGALDAREEFGFWRGLVVIMLYAVLVSSMILYLRGVFVGWELPLFFAALSAILYMLFFCFFNRGFGANSERAENHMRQMKKSWVVVIRWIGRQVCRAREHRYFYPGGEVRSWAAYSCIRCGELDRPLESLPYRPEDEEYEPTFSDEEYQQENERQYQLERRWISWLPYPRWV